MNNLLKKDKITFQFLLNDSIGGLWYWDHHHPETAFKRSILYSILGYNEHEISLESDKWDHIINQEDLNTALNKFNNLIKAPTHTFDQTLRYRNKNGSIVLLKFLGIIQFNNNGALNRIVGIIQQVSKNQNIAFKNTQKDTDLLKYKSYIENSPDGVFITNEKGQYIEVNKAACDISGYTEKELLQLTIPDLLQEGYLDNAKEHFDKVVNEGFAKGEFGYLKKTGEERFWSIDAVKLSENRFMGFVKDITLQKQAIDNNIQNINFTNTVLESLSHPFYVIDANNYKIKLANPASGLQKNPEKISCYELTHKSKIPCSNTNHPCPLQEVKETGKPAKLEHTHFDKDGNLKNVEVHAYPIFNDQGEVTQMIEYVLDITKRKKAEQEIKESYEQKREILDNTKIHIWAFNGDVYTYMNKEWFDFTGQNANKPYTIDRWIQCIHPDDLDKATKIWLKNWESKTEHDNFFRLRNAKGQYKHFFSHAVPVFDSNGNFKHFHGYNIDINELKQKEFELIKLTAAIQQSPSVITITDLEGRLQYINPKFTELTGYQKQEALGEKPSLLKSGCQTDDYYKNLWETISSGKTWHGEFHNKKKNGDLFWEKATISPIFNQSNEITNYVKLAEDITEQKRIEETQKILLDISKTVNQYDSLFHFIETIHEKIKTILRADNFYVALYHQDDNTYSFPYHVDEIDTIELNKPFDFSNGLTDYVFKSNRSMIIRPDDHKNITEYAIKGYGDNQSVWLGVPLKPSDKSKPIGVIAIQDYKNLESYTERDKAVFEIIAYHIFGFIQRIKYMEDIIAAKEKAEKNEKLKSAFLANMSHEIRTPMNGVLGFLELLQEPDISEYERQDFLNRIKKSGNRLLNTINDIIEFSNIDTNEIKNINQELCLNDVLEELIEFFQLEASNKSIDLKLQIDPQLKNSLIISDRNKIISIFTNLIKNALKFTSSGCICVGCDLNTDHINCFVKDTGIGIPKHKQKIIFERFRQANDYQTGDNEGSGLGLAITKAYVEMMGGEIKLVSEPGKGSEFIFTFDYIAAH